MPAMALFGSSACADAVMVPFVEIGVLDGFFIVWVLHVSLDPSIKDGCRYVITRMLQS